MREGAGRKETTAGERNRNGVCVKLVRDGFLPSRFFLAATLWIRLLHTAAGSTLPFSLSSPAVEPLSRAKTQRDTVRDRQ